MVRSKERVILFLEKLETHGDGGVRRVTTLFRVTSLDVHDGTVRTNFEFDVADEGFDLSEVEFDYFLICEDKWLLISFVQTGSFINEFYGIYVFELLDAHQFRQIDFLRLPSNFHWLACINHPAARRPFVSIITSDYREVRFLELNECGHLSERSSFSDDNVTSRSSFFAFSRSRFLTLDDRRNCTVYNAETGEREFALVGDSDRKTPMVSLTRNELILASADGFGVTAYCLDESRILALEEQTTAANDSSQA